MSMTRDRMTAFWAGWLTANRTAERDREWGPLAACYPEDATDLGLRVACLRQLHRALLDHGPHLRALNVDGGQVFR